MWPITIVASILLAFAIEAWWSERQDRANEADLLSRLYAEIAVNIERSVEPQYAIGFQDAIDLFEAVGDALKQGKDALEWPSVLLQRISITRIAIASLAWAREAGEALLAAVDEAQAKSH